MTFNFGEVLTRAWQIIWKHRVLWIFGILAGCSRGGSSGGGGGGGNGFSNPSSFNEIEGTMNRVAEWITNNPWVIVLFVLAIIVIVILSIYLGTIGRIALIKGTYQAEQGAESLVFGQLFSESSPYFWRVFGLSFLIGLVYLVIFLPMVAFGALTAGVGFLCLLPVICLLIPFALAVNIIIEQANAAIVLDDLSITDGFRRGWDIVKSNVGPVLIMAIILGVLSFVIGLIIAIPIIITVFPLIFGIANGTRNWLWIAGICCAVYFPIMLVLNGILTSFVQSAWTLTYMRLTKPQDNAPVVLEANA